MRCKCGNEIRNVPEHLRDLVNWLCEKCISTSPRRTVKTEQTETSEKKDTSKDEQKAA
ncbi:MAG: hypothetical protein ACUVRS_08660 [Armatimonadota bacterium]